MATAKQKQQRTVAKMTPGLKAAYQEIRKSWTTATRSDVLKRYRIAVQVKRVRDGDGSKKYGGRAIERLAAALGRHRRTLYFYAGVADCWNERQLRNILKRKNPHGQPVTWSHLIELAQVVDEERRQELLDKTLDEGLSARELRRQIYSSSPNDEDELSRDLRFAVRHLRAEAQSVVQNADRWDALLFARLEKENPTEIDATLLKELGAACEEHKKAATTYEKQAAHLTKFLAKARKAAPGVP